MRSEAALERKVVRDAAVKHGIPSIKLNGRGETGWPDRLFLMPLGLGVFIEFKAPGGRLSPKQRVKIELLDKIGHRVYVCSTYEDAMRNILRMKGGTE